MSNAHVDRIKDKTGFRSFALDRSTLSPEERTLLKTLPHVNDKCMVRTNPNRSGSAFSQMKENVILVGYMRGTKGIRALVVYLERPCEETVYDFGFVEVQNLRPIPVPKKESAK